MKHKKMITFIGSSCIMICFTLLFSITINTVLASDTIQRSPAIRTEEVTSSKTYSTLTSTGVKNGYVYFRSRADIEDVSERLISIHSYKVYPGGIATCTATDFSISIPNRYIIATYTWALSAYSSGGDVLKNYH